jgi:hypothetical protein
MPAGAVKRTLGANRPALQRSNTTTGMTLYLSDELAARVAEEAARQSITPEELAAHTLAEYVVTRPHHAPATIHEPSAPAAEPTRPAAATPGAQRGGPRRNALRLTAEIPSAPWIALSLLFCAAMFILIVVLIAQAL